MSLPLSLSLSFSLSLSLSLSLFLSLFFFLSLSLSPSLSLSVSFSRPIYVISPNALAQAVRGPLVKNELALPDWLAACPMAEAQGDMPGKQALLRKEVTQALHACAWTIIRFDWSPRATCFKAQEDADMEKKQQREEKKQQAKAKAKAKPKAKGRKSKTAQPAGESHEPQPSQPCSAKRPEPEPTHPETSNTEPQPKASDKKRKTTAAQKPDPSAHVAQQEEQQQQQPATSIKRSAESARSANKRAKVEVDGKSNEPPPTEDAMEEKDMAEIQQSTKKVEAGEARTVKARLGYTELFTNKIPDLPFPEGSFTRKQLGLNELATHPEKS